MGSVHTSSLVLVGLTINRLNPALRISLNEGLPAYQSLAGLSSLKGPGLLALHSCVHQEKKSASGRTGCVQTHQTLGTLWTHPGRAHTAPNAKRTGNVNSDAVHHGTVHSDAVCQGAVSPDAAGHGICLPD